MGIWGSSQFSIIIWSEFSFKDNWVFNPGKQRNAHRILKDIEVGREIESIKEEVMKV